MLRAHYIAKRSYATAGGASQVIGGWTDRLKKLMNRASEKQTEEADKPATEAKAADAKVASDEAKMRKAATFAAREARRKAMLQKQEEKRTREAAAKVAAMPVPDAVKAALTKAGLPTEDLRTVALDDLAVKGKVVASFMESSQVLLSHTEITQIQTAADLLRTASLPRAPIIKHPVAKWFLDQQAAKQLPPNVMFVPFNKSKKLELRKLF
ncbi:hypothetical protein AMAG_01199 [Allomyces macrogynus ATCC 38327]|uniref:Uncharacterized protein n=1 Tax=Allomyces macrogynus (strain ATCC 38327) TaxID=578462 RepID=A0A0L0RY16_ALLM3|nr:hypothetical protein AMAG_01199 [Allomyces macrogynus ATCC 38327]|eukprot:KNE55292.1 hypothetical protein AMAG_01199 [Allomyces macrogynus ATCC 38327]